MPLMFTPDDLNFMIRLRTAFNPDNRCSPGKMLPTAGGCSEPSLNGVIQTKPGRRAAV
jgi:glycolate oxidase